MDKMKNTTARERQGLEMDTFGYVIDLYSLFGYRIWMDTPSKCGSKM